MTEYSARLDPPSARQTEGSVPTRKATTSQKITIKPTKTRVSPLSPQHQPIRERLTDEEQEHERCTPVHPPAMKEVSQVGRFAYSWPAIYFNTTGSSH